MTSKYKLALRQILVYYDRMGIQVRDTNHRVQGQYDPNKKITYVNPNLSRKQYVSTLVHQISHALQDLQGYFQKKSLCKGQQLYQDFCKNKKRYIPYYHQKRVNRVVKMQYDRQRRAFQLIRDSHDIKNYIDYERYLNDRNFYILLIKYRAIKNCDKQYDNDDVNVADKRPIVLNREMTDQQVRMPITLQQIKWVQQNMHRK